MTFGAPLRSIISPTYRKPVNGAPSAAMPAMVGRTISSRMRRSTSGVTTGAGEYAPMPPVFGPRSPSSRRLWSWLVASGSTCAPSLMTM